MLILLLFAHSTRVLPFLILVVTFLIHSHLTSDMCKSFKTCSLFAISILIRVKVRLEFSVLFSLFRYIFVYFSIFSISIIFIFLYLCYNGFLLYVMCEFPISVSHVITLITSEYSIILQKIHLSPIILSLYVFVQLNFSFPPLWKKGILTVSLNYSSLSLEASCFL